MITTESITLSRDCEAIEIPYGGKVMLPVGTRVRITQALGGAFTVATESGNMVRIAGKDGDAIGVETSTPDQSAASPMADASELEKMVWAQLTTVYDPEIPVNVVDLGLVYECRIIPLPEAGYKVKVKMTLTAPGCGMGDVLRADAHSKVLSLPDVKDVHVEIVVEPPWNQSMMSEAARLQLGLY
jgi:probable FeS assembly SUF system protein SufT